MIANHSPKVNKQLLKNIFFHFFDGLKMTSDDTQTYPQHGQTILEKSFFSIICYHNISYLIIWYHIKWYHIIWYHIIWYHIIWYHKIWYDTIWYNIIWYDIIWYDIISRPRPCDAKEDLKLFSGTLPWKKWPWKLKKC